MKELKKVSDWYNAATHALTSVFSYYIVMYILSSLAGLAVGVALGPQTETASSAIIITYILELVSVWFAVYFSSQFLRKRYTIDLSAKKHIINLSTIYTGIIVLLYIVFQVVLSGSSGMQFMQFLINLVSFVPHIIIFYFASKKYLSITTSTQTSPEENLRNV